MKRFPGYFWLLVSLMLSAGFFSACLSHKPDNPAPTLVVTIPLKTPSMTPSPPPVLRVTPTPTDIVYNKWYVSTTGSDKNSGENDHPWLTIQYAVDHAHPGDTIYVRAGTYRENIVIRTSGTSTAPMTLVAYPQENVTIDGNSNTAITASGPVSYWIIDGFTIKSSNRYTLRLGWWGDPMTDHWIVRNNYLFGANFILGFNHLWVNNNIDGTGYTGVNGDAGITEGGDSHHNIYRNNTIHDFTQKEARGIWSQGETHDTLIEGNTISNIVDGISSKGQCIDLDGAGQVEWRHIVRANQISNCNYVGIQLENAFNTLVENNRVSDTKSAGLIIINYNSDIGCKVGGENKQYGSIHNIGDCRGEMVNDTIRQNIVINGGVVGGVVSYATSGVDFYDNLVYESGAGLYLNDSANFINHWDVRGNIFSGNTRAEISLRDAASLSLETNNLYYHPITNDYFEFIKTNSSVFYSLVYWQNTFNLGQNSIQRDPLFVDPVHKDFHLQADSPAIGAGVNFNIAQDIEGNPRPDGAAGDIGPYEFVKK